MKNYFLLILIVVTFGNVHAGTGEALKDSILKIKELPYMCKGSQGDHGCGDKYYWVNVNKGNEAVPDLIEIIDDNMSVGIPVPYFSGNYTVGDIAIFQIWEINKEFPLEEIIKSNIGYAGGNEMGGFWYYWLFVREKPENRTLLKKEVSKWWFR